MGTESMLKVMSWNVHSCIGRDGRFNPEAVADTVARLAPDVVALQEVDARHEVTGGVDTFEFLRTRLGWHAAEARTLRGENGDYGHMLMSRYPLQVEESLDISVPGRQPRIAISGRLRDAPGQIRILATHLGLKARERRYQLRRLLDHLGQLPSGATLILGDFNEWRPRGLAHRLFCPPFEAAAVLPTFPARRPLFPLDRIWCRTPLRAIRGAVDRRARHLSDHLPLLAELHVEEPAD